MRKKILYFFVFILFIKTYSQVGINTEKPEAALHIIPKTSQDHKVLRLDQLKREFIGESRVLLGIDSLTNNVVKIDGVPIVTTYFKSSDNQYLKDLNTNNGAGIVISFKSTDALLNSAVSFDDNSDIFTLLTSGNYELGGVINFNPGRTSYSDLGLLHNSERIVINVKIEYSYDDGVTWKDLTGTRKVYNFADADLNTSIIIPPVIAVLSAKTKIRMVVMRPSTVNSDYVANTDTQSSLPDGYPHINKPTGMSFTKSIKIFRY